jgi:NAD(P)-dependent dehydrogenase (short-subunit alcohol dehydrogenase family)
LLVDARGAFAGADSRGGSSWPAVYLRCGVLSNAQYWLQFAARQVCISERFGDAHCCNAGHRGDSPQHWHYAAAKGGMLAMTKSIARGYAAQNILAFAITPGFTMTGMAEEYLASRGGDKLLADIPLGRVAMPEEVAEMIRWLASDAPASMTGATLDINGASYVR